MAHGQTVGKGDMPEFLPELGIGFEIPDLQIQARILVFFLPLVTGRIQSVAGKLASVGNNQIFQIFTGSMEIAHSPGEIFQQAPGDQEGAAGNGSGFDFLS